MFQTLPSSSLVVLISRPESSQKMTYFTGSPETIERLRLTCSYVCSTYSFTEWRHNSPYLGDVLCSLLVVVDLTGLECGLDVDPGGQTLDLYLAGGLVGQHG